MPPGTISGFWDAVVAPVPAPDNQPVCPICGDGQPYKRDELECVHGHRFFWIQAAFSDGKFYAVVSNEYLLDYVMMKRWGLLDNKARGPEHGSRSEDPGGVV